MTELQPLKFTDSVNNIEFRVQGDTAPQEIIRLDSKGFHYRGQLIEDAGEAHRLMVEFLKQSTQSQPEPAPTDEDLEDLAEVMNVSGNPVPAMRRALELWGRPAIKPVPVSERLPGPEDSDAEGQCWWWHPDHKEDEFSDGWMLLEPRWADGRHDSDDSLIYTHWLPHHALPMPQQEVQ